MLEILRSHVGRSFACRLSFLFFFSFTFIRLFSFETGSYFSSESHSKLALRFDGQIKMALHFL